MPFQDHITKRADPRGWEDICRDILAYCSQERKQTEIMYECNLNSKNIKQYINLLVKIKLLDMTQISGNRYLYKTSERGIVFLGLYQQIQELLP